MSTNAATRTASVVVGLLMGLTACGGDDREAGEPSAVPRDPPEAAGSVAPPPQRTVEVRLEGVRATEGSFVAGVLFRADGVIDIRHTNAVGGFGVEVEDDPLSEVATINEGSSGFIPHLEGPVADVSPGTYTLMMWRGPTLGPYSKWFPAAEPGLTGCPVQVTVGDDAVTTVTVTGFPRQPKDWGAETMRPCRQ